jgi:hypothetical protein
MRLSPHFQFSISNHLSNIDFYSDRLWDPVRKREVQREELKEKREREEEKDREREREYEY